MTQIVRERKAWRAENRKVSVEDHHRCQVPCNDDVEARRAGIPICGSDRGGDRLKTILGRAEFSFL